MTAERRRATPAAPTVERRIVFYKVDAGLDEDGVPLAVDLNPALRRVDGLPFSDVGRYLVGDNDVATCCWVDVIGPRSRVRLANVRRQGLPQLEETGTLGPLPIRPEQGIAEQAYIVLFPEEMHGVPVLIAGGVFNVYGPRVPRLGYYLSRRAPGLTPVVSIRPLLRHDAVAAIDRLRDIRLLRLRIARPYVAAVGDASESLGDAFAAMASVGAPEDIEVVLRPRRRSRNVLGDDLLGVARRLVRREELVEGMIDFEVKGLNGETGQIDLVDVLNDKLVSRKSILRSDSRSRALDDSSAYEAIESAFAELHDDLVTAASIWVAP